MIPDNLSGKAQTTLADLILPDNKVMVQLWSVYNRFLVPELL